MDGGTQREHAPSAAKLSANQAAKQPSRGVRREGISSFRAAPDAVYSLTDRISSKRLNNTDLLAIHRNESK